MNPPPTQTRPERSERISPRIRLLRMTCEVSVVSRCPDRGPRMCYSDRIDTLHSHVIPTEGAERPSGGIYGRGVEGISKFKIQNSIRSDASCADRTEDLIETLIEALPKWSVEGRHSDLIQLGAKPSLSMGQGVSEFGRPHPTKADHQLVTIKPQCDVTAQPAFLEDPLDLVHEVNRRSVIHLERPHTGRFYTRLAARKKPARPTTAPRFSTSDPPGGRIRDGPDITSLVPNFP